MSRLITFIVALAGFGLLVCIVRFGTNQTTARNEESYEYTYSDAGGLPNKNLTLDGAYVGSSKTVIIFGLGRSGSSLLGSLFKIPNWRYYYEPLRDHIWENALVERQKASASSQCQLRGRLHCPVSDALYLLEMLHCNDHVHARQVAEMEIDGGSGENFIQNMARSMPLNLTNGGGCDTDFDGVALKTIRMNGEIDTLFQFVDALEIKLDLAVHLLRDPRAVLASRWGVGWGHPSQRNYEETFKWATEVCTQTMADYKAGAGRDEYLLLRYEDLASNSVKTAEKLYERIGRPIPPVVLEKMTENDIKSGLISNRVSKIDGKKAYGLQPRNFKSQLLKWKTYLNKSEIKAVTEGCKEVLETHYSDWAEMFADA